jgi:magnesium chelatase subunit H
MKLLRRLPKILRFIPGKAQDLRAWFLTMQYWLAGRTTMSSRWCGFSSAPMPMTRAFKGARAAAPIDYPDVGLYHPDLPGHRIVTDVADLPNPENPVATVGLLMMRSYVLSSDTGHYDGVIRKMQDAGLAVIPAFAGGLDGRPAIDAYFSGGRIDALVSLTGFSLIGGPAYNDSNAAVETLKGLDVPYLAAHPLEFQTLGQWASSDGGLGPVETTMLMALPEIDGRPTRPSSADATGRRAARAVPTTARGGLDTKAMAPCLERIDSLVEKTRRLARCGGRPMPRRRWASSCSASRRMPGPSARRRICRVFESLFNTLTRMKAEGYASRCPKRSMTCALRSCMATPSSTGRRRTSRPMWTPTPSCGHAAAESHRKRLGPGAGQDPVGRARRLRAGPAALRQCLRRRAADLRLRGRPDAVLFEKGFAPTHAFVTFYLWLQQHLPGRCAAAFRDAWRAGIHAGQAGRAWARATGPTG